MNRPSRVGTVDATLTVLTRAKQTLILRAARAGLVDMHLPENPLSIGYSTPCRPRPGKRYPEFYLAMHIGLASHSHSLVKRRRDFSSEAWLE